MEMECRRFRSDTHRLVVGGGTLLVTGIVTTPVLAVTTVTTGGAVSAVGTGTATVARRTALGTGGLHVGLGHDLRGQVEELAEVGETLVGEGVVVVLPGELGLDVALGGERLHGLDHLEVSDGGEVRVRGAVEVLGRDEDTLLEEGLVDLRERQRALIRQMTSWRCEVRRAQNCCCHPPKPCQQHLEPSFPSFSTAPPHK